MAWIYYFGFKLSGRAKKKLESFLNNKGYTVLEVGWDFVKVSSKLSADDKSTVQDVENLFQEEEI